MVVDELSVTKQICLMERLLTCAFFGLAFALTVANGAMAAPAGWKPLRGTELRWKSSYLAPWDQGGEVYTLKFENRYALPATVTVRHTYYDSLNQLNVNEQSAPMARKGKALNGATFYQFARPSTPLAAITVDVSIRFGPNFLDRGRTARRKVVRATLVLRPTKTPPAGWTVPTPTPSPTPIPPPPVTPIDVTPTPTPRPTVPGTRPTFPGGPRD